MFELELEWIVGAGSGEKQEDYCPTPPHFFLLTVAHPFGKHLFRSQPISSG